MPEEWEDLDRRGKDDRRRDAFKAGLKDRLKDKIKPGMSDRQRGDVLREAGREQERTSNKSWRLYERGDGQK